MELQIWLAVQLERSMLGSKEVLIFKSNSSSAFSEIFFLPFVGFGGILTALDLKKN